MTKKVIENVCLEIEKLKFFLNLPEKFRFSRIYNPTDFKPDWRCCLLQSCCTGLQSLSPRHYSSLLAGIVSYCLAIERWVPSLLASSC